MYQNSYPIGVVDLGVGGLTAVRQLQRLLPGEDIVFFGDSANCSGGERSADELYALTLRALRYLESQQVKCAALACGAMAALADRLRPECPFPLISSIESCADYVVREKWERVGVLADAFTVSSGAYEARIRAQAPDCSVVSRGSAELAEMIEKGDFNQSVIDEEVTAQIDVILARENVSELVLGCSHFPLVADNIRRCFPQLRLVDPADQLALAVKNMLVYRTLTNPQTRGTLRVETSGEPEVYSVIANLLDLHGYDDCKVISLA